ncbi:galectin-7 [Pan troglodytes]|uniref:galectin-7 n=1 Tax=Pan troglodytes TaxID=9598 RepID=UPI0030137648
MSVSAPGARGGAKQGGGWGLLFQRSKWAVSVPWTGLGCGLRWPLHPTLAERPPQVLAARGHPPWHGAENSRLGSSQCQQVPCKPAVRGGEDLLCGEEQGSGVALHFNPWLDTSEVVFNSKEQGSWGREERGPGVPFQRGQPFEVLIIASDDGFKAVVGDAQYHHFRHRLPLARVRLVEVGGDVQLDSVRIF